MKAILNQWIGGFKGSAETQTKPSFSQTKTFDDATAPEKQSFMGLMMGFLGMNSQNETAEKSAAGVQENQISEKEKNTLQTAMGNSNITDKKHATTAPGAATTQNATANAVLAANTSPSEPESLIVEKNASPTKTVSPESTSKTGLQKAEMISRNGNQPSQLTFSNKPLGNLTPKMSTNLTQQAPAQTAVSSGSEKPTWIGQKVSGSGSQKDVAIPVNQGALVDDKAVTKTSTKAEHTILEKTSSAPTDKTPSNKKGTQKLQSLIRDQEQVAPGSKKEVKPQKNKNIQALREVNKSHGQNKRPALESLISGNKNVFKQPAPGKPNSGSPELVPGKLVSSQPEKIDLQMDFDTTKEQTTESETRSKDFTLSNFKSAQINEAAGRKSFSRQLAQVTRQQFSQAQGSTRQNSTWKHHRFVLKDGSSIQIAARSADGGLQLQLNAGNGELGKIIQQHLTEIQQHVQQELNIKIDLQLQNSGGQQAGDQPETSSKSKATNASSGNSNGDINQVTGAAASRPNVRYLGFNQNEWTA